MTDTSLQYIALDPFIACSDRMQKFCVELAGDDASRQQRDAARWTLVSLLLWAGQARVSGHLGQLSAWALAEAVAWPGDPQKLMHALLNSGWLIETERGLYIEGWDRHAGRAWDKRRTDTDSRRTRRGHAADVREKDRARKRAKRALGQSQGHNRQCPSDIRPMSSPKDQDKDKELHKDLSVEDGSTPSRARPKTSGASASVHLEDLSQPCAPPQAPQRALAIPSPRSASLRLVQGHTAEGGEGVLGATPDVIPRSDTPQPQLDVLRTDPQAALATLTGDSHPLTMAQMVHIICVEFRVCLDMNLRGTDRAELRRQEGRCVRDDLVEALVSAALVARAKRDRLGVALVLHMLRPIIERRVNPPTQDELDAPRKFREAMRDKREWENTDFSDPFDLPKPKPAKAQGSVS